ncbi:LOW QUALITY PROTEIN: hypothetical protein T552_04200 [Pneumocystis carinii B80]|uniref:Uncharacterized protein n=1 Tax=Pneumocystis carinii (strain B80) TaxID=1408658 RepID=A0A0W4ZBX3_PNEC8|nr:LOW QUALITY PROTEIN: hypothetical protein T552_04200 [Pneumocystis carinii B80]KTW25883.1 LOW QUALITY PROTEIN: hypothetical protein T552_04200 [Pneumocystis carinii B80]
MLNKNMLKLYNLTKINIIQLYITFFITITLVISYVYVYIKLYILNQFYELLLNAKFILLHIILNFGIIKILYIIHQIIYFLLK